MSTVEHAELEAEIRERWDAGDLRGAATTAVRGYGPELIGYLVAVLRSEPDASEVFSALCEALWKGLPDFRWQCSFRTWAYVLARHAMLRQQRDLFHRERAIPLSQAPEVFEIADRVRTATLRFLRTEVRDRVALLREQLAPEDQTLFILRINRRMSWNEIARILGDGTQADDGGREPDQDALKKQAAALRKQFQRAKERLRQLAEEQQPELL